MERESRLRPKPVIDEAHADLHSVIRNGNELSQAPQRAVCNDVWEQCGVCAKPAA